MFFEIKKKVGSNESKAVKSVRSNELVQVHPWWDWFDYKGKEVNYFVYTSLNNHDLYCYVDREFLAMYKSRGLANNLDNIINQEMADKGYIKGYTPRYNLFDVINDLDGVDIDKMSTSDIRKMMRYLASIRKDAINRRASYVYEEASEYLRLRGISFYLSSAPTETDKRTIYRLSKGGKSARMIIWKETFQIPVTDKEIIKQMKKIKEKEDEADRVRKLRQEYEDAVNKAKKAGEALPEKPVLKSVRFLEAECKLLSKYKNITDDNGEHAVVEVKTKKHHDIVIDSDLATVGIADPSALVLLDQEKVAAEIRGIEEAIKRAERDRFLYSR